MSSDEHVAVAMQRAVVEALAHFNDMGYERARHVLAVVERAAAVKALRDYANWIDRVYSDRLFPKPMEEDYAEAHRALMANRGVSLDRMSADLMRRAGQQARDRADEIESGASDV